MDRPVLLMGGYGKTDRRVAELLLHADTAVVLTGRDLGRARAAVDDLRTRHGADRISALCLDAADAAGLGATFADVGFVVDASNTVLYTEQIARAALFTGVDYLDTQFPLPAKLEVLRRLVPQVERDGRCFITDAVFHPGVPAAMVRLATDCFDVLERAQVGSCIQINWRDHAFSDAAMPEILNQFDHSRPRRYEAGRWTESWTTYR